MNQKALAKVKLIKKYRQKKKYKMNSLTIFKNIPSILKTTKQKVNMSLLIAVRH